MTTRDSVGGTTSDQEADLGGVAVTITPQENGPYSVTGPFGLTRPDGTVEVVERVTLCRCGQSANKPRCDGTHIRVGFKAPGVSR